VRQEPAGLDRTRWIRLWTRLGASGNAAPVFDQLASAYAEPTRAYHTAGHIDDCLGELDRHRGLAQSPDLVEAAIWFHDAVYVPGATDNEARSADLARTALALAGVSSPATEGVKQLVLATRHAMIPREPDAQLLCDIDLSILGRSPAEFDTYEQQIRQEYAWVPEALYRRTRARILAEFLGRRSIYQTPAFSALYESRARENLARSVSSLLG
jgi:predicted metal-dependent HD superfamily phosphohydrolase